ncbi:hypothetical protein CPU12_10020 [Malaciobacter molluscorum LMG 25693]|uniref:Uncharacterized protein n=1 Tax=Malaciobacter molluscorum LMG 25693 TaxID=870501 RepID=A0A2G1DG69_9BACT|nr:hypothetical protein [Malaciobacter molluscorum]AXX93488.1 hypothetical protein AMOL_2549 [Malaciobacter molluscorum LMG 25693]PHO17498.1 hypothetical protein CPU12_10020 [Malaciobacter molluscorum LMG 25693]
MLEILSSIFGNSEVIKKGLDLIDDAWTSEGEKTENQAKLIEAKTKAKIDLISAYAPFKIAQRYLALLFTIVFLFIMVNGVFAALYGWVDINNVQKALDFANKMWLGEIMLAIVSFYFGGGFIESVNRKKAKQ